MSMAISISIVMLAACGPEDKVAKPSQPRSSVGVAGDDTPSPDEGSLAADGPQVPADGLLPPPVLEGEFVCVSAIIAIVREAGPFTIDPIAIPPSDYPALRYRLRPTGVWTDLTFYPDVRDAAYEYVPEEGRASLYGDDGGHAYDFLWMHDAQGAEYLVQDVEDETISRYYCRRVAPENEWSAPRKDGSRGRKTSGG